VYNPQYLTETAVVDETAVRESKYRTALSGAEQWPKSRAGRSAQSADWGMPCRCIRGEVTNVSVVRGGRLSQSRMRFRLEPALMDRRRAAAYMTNCCWRRLLLRLMLLLQSAWCRRRMLSLLRSLATVSEFYRCFLSHLHSIRLGEL